MILKIFTKFLLLLLLFFMGCSSNSRNSGQLSVDTAPCTMPQGCNGTPADNTASSNDQTRQRAHVAPLLGRYLDCTFALRRA